MTYFNGIIQMKMNKPIKTIIFRAQTKIQRNDSNDYSLYSKRSKNM